MSKSYTFTLPSYITGSHPVEVTVENCNDLIDYLVETMYNCMAVTNYDHS